MAEGSPVTDPSSNLPTGSGELFGRVYAELRRLAQQQMQNERGDHTLQATALVSEAWLRLRDHLGELSSNRGRFFVAAAESMRRILIEHARGKGRQKRGGDLQKLSLDVVRVADSADLDQVLAIDAAIDSLKQVSERAAELVQLRFFAGLTEAEAATSMGISERTARREWMYARAHLFKELND